MRFQNLRQKPLAGQSRPGIVHGVRWRCSCVVQNAIISITQWSRDRTYTGDIVFVGVKVAHEDNNLSCQYIISLVDETFAEIKRIVSDCWNAFSMVLWSSRWCPAIVYISSMSDRETHRTLQAQSMLTDTIVSRWQKIEFDVDRYVIRSWSIILMPLFDVRKEFQ